MSDEYETQIRSRVANLGTDISTLEHAFDSGQFYPKSRFNPPDNPDTPKNNGHAEKKHTVLDRLGAFFERYFGLA
jgi:hypothetical protein